MKILSKLNTLVKQWVRDVSVSKNMLESLVEKLGRKIYTFESYRLGSATCDWAFGSAPVPKPVAAVPTLTRCTQDLHQLLQETVRISSGEDLKAIRRGRLAGTTGSVFGLIKRTEATSPELQYPHHGAPDCV
ncbi:hypothetical protein quinque_008281 [Culex quinquefasciatus]